jgi:hypothetical protein
VYCYHDGVALEHRAGVIPADGSAINIGTKPFTVPFVFPTGGVCANFQQLAEACQREPAAALDMLRKGHLETFLAGQGRIDLASAAHNAARAASPERGLDEILGRLPFPLPRARLRVEPAVLNLGTVRVGDERHAELTLHNDGMRLLYGTAECEAPWVALGSGTASNKLLQFFDRLVLPVRVVGGSLRALDKPQEAEIRLDTNGGTATVTVRLQVPVKPFAEGALAGALSPRQWAKKAHDVPKEAAALIESGAVARWYGANGWTYPVLGPAATGLAAVQQLFEALGLVKPPKVELSEDAIRLTGRAGERIEYSLAVITQESRAAIAHGTSDQPWLQVGTSIFRGRSAFLPLLIAAIPGRPGETLQAVVSVTANGGQHFAVPVTVAVGGRDPAAPAAVPAPPRREPVRPAISAPPVARVAPAPLPMAKVAPAQVPVATAAQVRVPTPLPVLPPVPPARAGSRRRAVLLSCVPAVLLVAVALGGALRDWLAPEQRGLLSDAGRPVDSTPRLEIRVHDVTQNDVLDTLYLPDHQATMRFGAVMLRQGKEIGTGIQARRLTFDPWGRTNNTCFRFEKTDERLFGSGSRGHWQGSAAKTWKDNQGQEHDGVKSVWVWDDNKVEVSQLVELVRGPQSGLLDTCRVRYQIVNRDVRPHDIGIRFLLDTYIGGNDGVPFTIPGEPDLCDTMKDLPAQAKDGKMPDFLEALEKPDLAHPGTIAHLRLKLGSLEAPQRVTLGAWPNEKLRVLDRLAAGPLTLWDVPLVPLKSLDLNDSAVTIYWQELPLAPAATREVGFEYGLGNLASKDSRLATIVDGAFRPNGQLTVVAYVNRTGQPDDGATVTLDVPQGFRLVAGAATQAVPKLPPDSKSGNVPITWLVEAGPTGSYEFHVNASFGLTQMLKVVIRESIY